MASPGQPVPVLWIGPAWWSFSCSAREDGVGAFPFSDYRIPTAAPGTSGRARESQRSKRGIWDRRSTRRLGPRGRAGARRGQGCSLPRKAQRNRAGNRHDGPFRPGGDRVSPWCSGRNVGAIPAQSAPVANAQDDQKQGQARTRSSMASQLGRSTRRHRANLLAKPGIIPTPQASAEVDRAKKISPA